MVNSETDKFKEMLAGLGKMQKDFSKFSSTLSSDLGGSFEKIMKESLVEFEKKTKINKKPATLSLMKDGSIKIVFDNPEDGIKFAKGEK